MHTSKNLNLINKIANKYNYNKELFAAFKHVYLFGSIVKEKYTPNDIDILLVYSVFDNEIVLAANKIKYLFLKEINIPIDLTILSEKETVETNFLYKIGDYILLK